MNVQITIARNEFHLIKELLPIWKKYADGFVFLLHNNTDETESYLESVVGEFNILKILKVDEDESCPIETDKRQLLFDEARKYTNKIICLDADEYLDGSMSKDELSDMLDGNPDTTFHLNWIQYTSINTIRVDGPWKNNIKDRVGNFTKPSKFVTTQMHSTHLPPTPLNKVVDRDKLFVAHLHWLDKNYAAIKQYYWKIEDYYNKTKFGIDVTDSVAYDASVNNFNWDEEYIEYPLKIREDFFEDVENSKNYKLDIIKQRTNEYNIPNLGDWGYNIRESIPMHFCTAADDKHYPLLINLIGSIHKHNFYDTSQIRVYDLGLTDLQKNELKQIKKVVLCDVEKTNVDILNPIKTSPNREVRGLFSWKPVIIKDSLEHCDYVLYLDAGTTILKPLNNLFKHIVENGYLLFDCGHSIKWMSTNHTIETFNLNSEENRWILNDETFGIDAGFMGLSRNLMNDFVLPMYNLSFDIKNFYDDGSCPDGWGTGRHDQTLYSIIVRKLNLNINYHDNPNIGCNLTVDSKNIPFHITHTLKNVNSETNVFRSRWSINYQSYKDYTSYIRRKYILSVITGIGNLKNYERFIEQYFNNIQQQINFDRIEFIIVYSAWSNIFDSYTNLPNVKFIKEDVSLGVYNAWNIGILNSTTEYITNWNVDDIRYPINNKIKYDLLSKNNEIDLVYNWYVAVTHTQLENGIDISTIPIQQYPDNYHLYTDTACMAGPDPLWRKSFHLFGGYFNYKEYSIIGDWEMWIRMARRGAKFKLIPFVLCIYVDHENTVSNSNSEKLMEQKLKINLIK